MPGYQTWDRARRRYKGRGRLNLKTVSMNYITPIVNQRCQKTSERQLKNYNDSALQQFLNLPQKSCSEPYFNAPCYDVNPRYGAQANIEYGAKWPADSRKVQYRASMNFDYGAQLNFDYGAQQFDDSISVQNGANANFDYGAQWSEENISFQQPQWCDVNTQVCNGVLPISQGSEINPPFPEPTNYPQMYDTFMVTPTYSVRTDDSNTDVIGLLVPNSPPHSKIVVNEQVCAEPPVIAKGSVSKLTQVSSILPQDEESQQHNNKHMVYSRPADAKTDLKVSQNSNEYIDKFEEFLAYAKEVTKKAEVVQPENSTTFTAMNKRTLKSVAMIPDTSPLYQGGKPQNDDYITVVLLGHSYIQRLRDDIARFIIESGYLQTVEEHMRIEDARVIPYFYGESGATLKSIPRLVANSLKNFPSIVIIDMCQNDLCWKENDPKTLAFNLYQEIQLMYQRYEKLELVIVCQVLQKHRMWHKKTNKSLETFNKDVDSFNYEFLKLTRRDKRVARWIHRGCSKLTNRTSKDGTHPNTVYGFWRYVKSVAALCRWARQEMFFRRTRSIWAAQKNRKAQRKAREKAIAFRKTYATPIM